MAVFIRNKGRNLLNTIADCSVTQTLKDIGGGIVESFNSKIFIFAARKVYFFFISSVINTRAIPGQK